MVSWVVPIAVLMWIQSCLRRSPRPAQHYGCLRFLTLTGGAKWEFLLLQRTRPQVALGPQTANLEIRAKEPLSNVTFSQWGDGDAGFSSLMQIPAVLRPDAVRLSAPYSSCGRECPAGKE